MTLTKPIYIESRRQINERPRAGLGGSKAFLPSPQAGVCRRVTTRRLLAHTCSPNGRNRRSDRNQMREHLVAQVSGASSPVYSPSELFLTSGTLETLLEPGKSFLHPKPPTKLYMSFHSLVGTEMIPAPPPQPCSS